MTADKAVVIVDRDGTIVVDRGYLSDPDGLEFLPGAADGLRWLHQQGHRIIVVTNQSGVGRRLFSMQQLEAMNQRLMSMFEAIGSHLAGIYSCPHSPDVGCDCRKPAQRLMLQAAADLGFEPAASIVIGDKDSDVEFGQRAGATTIRILAHDSSHATLSHPDFVVADFAGVIATISHP